MEDVVSPDAQAALVDVVLDAAEIDCLPKASVDYPLALLLTTVFSAKESFFKGVFGSVGYIFGFEAIRLEVVDCTKQYMDFELTETIGDQLSSGHSFRVGFTVLSPRVVLTYFSW